MTPQLSVYLYNQHVGDLRDIANAQLEFNYTSGYLNNPSLALSNSLPLKAETFTDSECRAFFAGLLPDDQELDNLARYLKVSKNNVFKLLSEVGGECAGAVSLFSKPQNSETANTEQPLSDLKLDELQLGKFCCPPAKGQSWELMRKFVYRLPVRKRKLPLLSTANRSS